MLVVRPVSRRAAAALGAGLVLAALALGWRAALADSITVDEPSHLLSGLAPLRLGDFRLSPDHPPLGRYWCALPLLGVSQRWIDTRDPAWQRGDHVRLGRTWLAADNDGYRLVRPARAMALLVLAALLVMIALTARALFGGAAACLALALAAFDPALLGNGHLVTMDVPFAAAALAVLLAFARWLERPNPARLLVAMLATGAAATVKFSFPPLLPALAAMAWMAHRRSVSEGDGARVPMDRGAAVSGARLAGGVLACVLAVPVVVWGVYGFRYAAFAGVQPAAMMETVSDRGRSRPESMAEAWEVVLHDPATAAPRGGALAPVVRFAREHRLLPEAYLYGFAFAQKKALYRSSYLLGEVTPRGRRTYFPVAFAVKTPLPTLLLLAAGAALLAVGRRRVRREAAPLAVGLATFSLLYAAAALWGHLAIGYRHLVPLLAATFVTAGAAAPRTRRGAAAVAALVAWLVLGTLRAGTQQLPYFNELAGGAAGGHRLLADSNLDWGQDLLRLADWASAHPRQRLLLAQFGGGFPPPGFAPETLLSDLGELPSAPLRPGTFVVSPTFLLGVYLPVLRDETWGDARFAAGYRRLVAERRHAEAAGAAGDPPPFDVRYEVLRRARLVSRLRQRPPDERIGTLFAYRLDAAEIERLTAP